MDYEWQLEVRHPDGTFRTTIHMDDPVDVLQSFAVEGSRNCLEATFSGIGLQLGLKPREIVTLEVREPEGAWEPIFTGFVASATDASYNLDSIRLAGLKERFYELLVQDAVVPGGTVMSMVNHVLSQAVHIPAGVSYSAGQVSLPSFQLADRVPLRESVGEFLDAMAASVPGVFWGVRADGVVFFRQKTSGGTVLNPGTKGVLVEWRPADAEEVVTAVTLMIPGLNVPTFSAARYRGLITDPALEVLAYAFFERREIAEHATYAAEALVRWEFGVPVTNRLSTAAVSSSNLVDPDTLAFDHAKAIDGDLATYAAWGDGASPASISLVYDGRLVAGWTLKYRAATSDTPVRATLIRTPDSFTVGIGEFYELELEPSDEDKTITILIPPDVRMPDEASALAPRSTLIIERPAVSTGFRIYDVAALELDPEAIDGVTGAFFKLPFATSGTVTKVGALHPISYQLPLSGIGTFDSPRYTFSLSRENGLVTTIELNQPEDADIMAARRLEDWLRERATRQALRFGR